MALQKSTVEPNYREEVENYRAIFSAIAVEIQRYLTSLTTENNTDKDSVFTTDLSTKLRNQEIQLKIKNKEITKLKNHIRSACVLAKTIISTKESEKRSLSTLLNCAQNEIKLLQDLINKKQDVIKKLSIDNQVLSDKLDSLTNFIDLGYGEILKITGENPQDIPVTFELRKIIVSCGKYYADFHIERQKNIYQHHRNLFLSKRLHALETILEANVRELDGLRHQNLNLHNENSFLKLKTIRTWDEKKSSGDGNYDGYTEFRGKDKSLTDIQKDISFMKNDLSEIKLRLGSILRDRTRKSCKEYKEQCEDISNESCSSVERHVLIVSNLLKDQEFMLEELKRISHELHSETKISSIDSKNKTEVFNCDIKKSSSIKVHVKYLKPFFEDRFMLDYDQAGIFNNFQDSREIAQNIHESFPVSQINSQVWYDNSYELFKRASNTMVIYNKKKYDRDEKSTCYGITSEMQQIMDGCVASKIQAFENISLNNYDLKRSSSASTYRENCNKK